MTTVILLGRKREAAAALDLLVERGIEVVGVVEDEDRAHPAQRPLEARAREKGVPVRALEDPSGPVDHVISYLFKRRVPPAVLALARVLPLNFHPAPLPDFRGLRGYNVAIVEGLAEWGATAHVMTDALDAGDIVAERRFAIAADDTAYSLERRTQREMLALFAAVADAIAAGTPLPRRPQGPGRSMTRAEFERLRRVDPSDPPELVARKIRAFWYPPYPGAYVEIGGRQYTLVDEEMLSRVAERWPPADEPPDAWRSEATTRR